MLVKFREHPGVSPDIRKAVGGQTVLVIQKAIVMLKLRCIVTSFKREISKNPLLPSNHIL
jgi:hypothetical protein